MATSGMNDLYFVMNEYTKNPTVQKRNYGGLMQWTSTILGASIPTSPTDDWIRERLLAQRVGQSPDMYVTRVTPMMLSIQGIIDSVCDQMAPYLLQAESSSVQSAIDAALQTVMPMFAVTDISQAQIDQWKTDNGIAKEVKT
jgi:hypothetical protein